MQDLTCVTVQLTWTLVMVRPLGYRLPMLMTACCDCMMGDQTLFTRADEVEAGQSGNSSALRLGCATDPLFPSMKLAPEEPAGSRTPD